MGQHRQNEVVFLLSLGDYSVCFVLCSRSLTELILFMDSCPILDLSREMGKLGYPMPPSVHNLS